MNSRPRTNDAHRSDSPLRSLRVGFIDIVLEPDKPGATGLSDLVWNMARELANLGDEVHIAAPYSVEVPPYPGITVHYFKPTLFGFRNIIGQILMALRAWSCLRRIANIDIIHAPEYVSTGIVSTFSRTPVVLTTPGNIYERVANYNHWDRSVTVTLKLFARASAKFASATIATSQEMRDWWLFTGCRPDRIHVIPLGIDSKLFFPAKNILDSSIKGQDLIHNANILFVGRLQKENNAELLIRSFARIVDDNIDAELIIVGDGEEEQALRDLCNKLDVAKHVVWAGRVPLHELPDFYRMVDIFAVPRLSRVTPRVLLEAMACGCAVVASDIGGIRDFIEDNITGYLFPPGDEHNMSIILRTLISDKERRLEVGRRAAEKAGGEWSWATIVNDIRKIIYLPLANDVY